MIDCEIRQTVSEQGRLISISDSSIKLKDLDITQITKINEDNYGIVLSDAEL